MGVTKVLINADGSNAIVGITLAACCEGSEVTISCGGLCFMGECFVHNVSFLTQRTIYVEEDGDVVFTNCKFKSTCTLDAAVVVYGLAKFIHCSIIDSPGGGITVEYSTALASLVNCKVNRNGRGAETSSGIKVIDQGSLEVNECQVHGNTKGIIVAGTKYNDSIAKMVLIQNSEIFDNKFEGVSVVGHDLSLSFEAVVIRRNKIYHNGAYGIRVQFYANNYLKRKRCLKTSGGEYGWSAIQAVTTKAMRYATTRWVELELVGKVQGELHVLWKAMSYIITIDRHFMKD